MISLNAVRMDNAGYMCGFIIFVLAMLMVVAPPMELRAAFAHTDAPASPTFPVPVAFTINLHTQPVTVQLRGKDVAINSTSCFVQCGTAPGIKHQWGPDSNDTMMAVIQALKTTGQFPAQFMPMRTSDTSVFKDRTAHAQAGNRTCRKVRYTNHVCALLLLC